MPRVRKASAKPSKSKRAKPPAVITDVVPEIQAQQLERFCQAMAGHGILVKAAIAAGLTGTDKERTRAARYLFDRPDVRARIDQINADLLRELRITTTAIKAGLARVAFFDPADLVNEAGDIRPLNAIPFETRMALQGYKVKTSQFGEGGSSLEKEVRFGDRIRALQLLGEDAGMWKDEGPADIVAILSAVAAARGRVALPYQPERVVAEIEDAGNSEDDPLPDAAEPSIIDAKPVKPLNPQRHVDRHRRFRQQQD